MRSPFIPIELEFSKAAIAVPSQFIPNIYAARFGYGKIECRFQSDHVSTGLYAASIRYFQWRESLNDHRYKMAVRSRFAEKIGTIHIGEKSHSFRVDQNAPFMQKLFKMSAKGVNNIFDLY